MTADLTTVDGVLKAILDASANRQYQLLGALFIILIVFIIRLLASKSDNKVAAFLKSDLGGVSLSILASAAGAAYSALKGGAKLDLNLALSALVNAALASGIFTYAKHAKRAMPKRAKKNASPPTSTLLPLLLIPTLILSSCGYCMEASHTAEPRCVLQQNMIKCGEQAGFGLLPIVSSIVISAIGGTFDASAVVAQLEQAGIKDIPCVLGALESFVVGNTAHFPPAMQSTTHKVLVAALAKRGARGKVTIKLKVGDPVEAVVQ